MGQPEDPLPAFLTSSNHLGMCHSFAVTAGPLYLVATLSQVAKNSVPGSETDYQYSDYHFYANRDADFDANSHINRYTYPY